MNPWISLWNSVSIDLLAVEPHTPTSGPLNYDKKDGQWYAHNGVDVKDTQQRKGKCHNSILLITLIKSSVDYYIKITTWKAD